MKPSTSLIASLVLINALASAAPPPPPEGVSPLAIGSPAPGFDLPGVDGKSHALGDYAEKDVLAVLFTCNHCPTAQAAEARVIQLVNDYADRSFQLVAISPNDPASVRIDELGYSVYGDTLEDMKLHAAENGFNFPYLYDGETQSVSRAFGAMATPHIFIFDTERKLRYQGRIDDSKYADGATQLDARNAIDALLAGEAVPVETTRVFGCSTKWTTKRDAVGQSEAAWQSRPVTIEPIDADGIRALVANPTSKLRLINIWATWCGPCVDEFPLLVSLGRQFESRGFDFISISIDDPSQIDSVRQFLESEHAALGKRTEVSVQEEGRTTNNYIFDQGADIDALAAALDPEFPGGVPYSLLIAPGGEILHREAGEIELLDMRRRVLDHLGRFYTP